jgi:predicted MFS family arabinose efflux permease
VSRSLRFQVLVFIAVRTVINTMIRMVYPFLSIFAGGLGVDPAKVSFALFLRQGAGITGPFLAAVGDSRGRRFGMLFGLVMFISGISLFILIPTYLTFVLMLILTLVGNFIFIPCMQAYLGDRVPYQQRGSTLAATELSWSFSLLLGVSTISLLIARFGWKAPFPVLAALGGLSFVILLLLLPVDSSPENRGRSLKNIRSVLMFPPAIAGLVMGASMSSANELVNVVFGYWLNDSFNIQVTALGIATGVIGLSELVAEILAGSLIDRLGKARSVIIGLVFSTVFFFLLPTLGQTLTGALAALFLVYLSFEFTLVSSLPLMTEVLPSARATLMAAYIASFSLGRAAGDLLALPLFNLGLPFIAVAGAGFNLVSIMGLLWLRKKAAEVKKLTGI